jgi:hypothetical protein
LSDDIDVNDLLQDADGNVLGSVSGELPPPGEGVIRIGGGKRVGKIDIFMMPGLDPDTARRIGEEDERQERAIAEMRMSAHYDPPDLGVNPDLLTPALGWTIGDADAIRHLRKAIAQAGSGGRWLAMPREMEFISPQNHRTYTNITEREPLSYTFADDNGTLVRLSSAPPSASSRHSGLRRSGASSRRPTTPGRRWRWRRSGATTRARGRART